MAAGNQPLPEKDLSAVRCEEREDTVRVVEYSRFPRNGPQQRQRVGFTRDLSRSGMCLGVDEAESIGSLLRLCTRDLAGRPGEARVGRVVWISPARDGRFWAGIQMLTPPAAPQLHCVHPGDDGREPTSF